MAASTPRPVVHFEIGATQAEGLRAFYGELFGWQFAEGHAGYQPIAPAARSIGGALAALGPERRPYVTIYVDVDDAAAALATAEQLGGKIIQAATAVPEFAVLGMFADPDGNVVGVIERRPGRTSASGTP